MYTLLLRLQKIHWIYPTLFWREKKVFCYFTQLLNIFFLHLWKNAIKNGLNYMCAPWTYHYWIQGRQSTERSTSRKRRQQYFHLSMVAGHGTRDRHHFTRNVQELSAVFGFQMDQTPKTELINNFVIFKFYCIVWIQTVGNLFLLLPDFLLFWVFYVHFIGQSELKCWTKSVLVYLDHLTPNIKKHQNF